MPKFSKTLFARELRQRSTHTEKIAWDMLRDRRFLGLRFKRQYVFHGFILDFYCFKHKLAIEIDGGIHEHQKGYDAWRQAIIEFEGLRFIRIPADELESRPETLLDQIRVAIQLPTPALTLPSSSSASLERGRG